MENNVQIVCLTSKYKIKKKEGKISFENLSK